MSYANQSRCATGVTGSREPEGEGLINTEGDELRVKGTTNQGEETNADQRETDSNTQRTEYKNKQRN